MAVVDRRAPVPVSQATPPVVREQDGRSPDSPAFTMYEARVELILTRDLHWAPSARFVVNGYRDLMRVMHFRGASAGETAVEIDRRARGGR